MKKISNLSIKLHTQSRRDALQALFAHWLNVFEVEDNAEACVVLAVTEIYHKIVVKNLQNSNYTLVLKPIHRMAIAYLQRNLNKMKQNIIAYHLEAEIQLLNDPEVAI